MSYRFQIDANNSVNVTHDSGAKDCLPSWTWFSGAVRQLIYERETLRVRVAELELAAKSFRDESDGLREAIRRALEAWDTTTNSKSHDGRLWQCMEELRGGIEQ